MVKSVNTRNTRQACHFLSNASPLSRRWPRQVCHRAKVVTLEGESPCYVLVVTCQSCRFCPFSEYLANVLHPSPMANPSPDMHNPFRHVTSTRHAHFIRHKNLYQTCQPSQTWQTSQTWKLIRHDQFLRHENLSDMTNFSDMKTYQTWQTSSDMKTYQTWQISQTWNLSDITNFSDMETYQTWKPIRHDKFIAHVGSFSCSSHCFKKEWSVMRILYIVLVWLHQYS